jgi:hypothetical protein
MFEAISGYFLDIAFTIEEKTGECKAMLAIPEGVKEDVESGLCEAWLWLREKRRIEQGTKLDITIVRLSEIEMMKESGASLDQYLNGHLSGYIGYRTRT